MRDRNSGGTIPIRTIAWLIFAIGFAGFWLNPPDGRPAQWIGCLLVIVIGIGVYISNQLTNIIYRMDLDDFERKQRQEIEDFKREIAKKKKRDAKSPQKSQPAMPDDVDRWTKPKDDGWVTPDDREKEPE